MDEVNGEATEGEEPASGPSRWEWLPFPIALALGILYLYAAPSGGALSRFCCFVGLALLPGMICRLLGRRSWNVHRVCFAAGLVAFVLDNPDLRPDRATLGSMRDHWGLVTAGFFISFTQPVWGMLRTQRLLTDSGVVIGKYDSLKLCLSGSFFNIFLPGSTGGDAYRVYAITKGYRAKLAPAIASITLDRFLGLPSLILVVLLGMILDYRFFLSNRILSGLIPFISGAGAVCAALVVYLTLAGRSRRRPDWERPLISPDGKPPGWLMRTHAMIATNVKRPATLPLALFYGFMAHLACIFSCMLFGMALGVEGVPALRYFLIVPMTMTINAIPGAPGGVGQGELAMATLLDMASPGMGNAQDGVMIMLLFRLSNMVLGLVGGVYYALGKMDFSGVDRVSQGLTRIMGARRSARMSERFKQAKKDSVRLLFRDPDESGSGDG